MINPAIQPNYCYSFFARNVRKVGKQQLDSNEETEVVLVPLRKIGKLIASGRITHALEVRRSHFSTCTKRRPACASDYVNRDGGSAIGADSGESERSAEH